MPALKPRALVPVPAPTLPSAGRSAEAESRAAKTCSGVIGRERMSDRYPSLVSPTTGLRLVASGSRSRSQLSNASATRNTDSVPVSRIGVSRTPNSSTCVDPTSFPYPLPTATAAGSPAANPGGTMAVTPVFSSPVATVVCPTSAPGTSVIAFNTPVGNPPGNPQLTNPHASYRRADRRQMLLESPESET